MAKSQYHYILLQLEFIAELDVLEYRGEVATAFREAGAQLGVEFATARFSGHSGPNRTGSSRIFFTLAGGKRNDAFANSIAEAILLCAELYYGPHFDFTYAHLAFPFRSSTTPSGTVSRARIMNSIDREVPNSRQMFTDQMVFRANGLTTGVIALAIRTAPYVLATRALRCATAFLAVAHHAFFVWPGQLRETLDDGHNLPTTTAELAIWEASYQNAYKAVEAVVGDPPRDEARYLAHLRNAGIDPDGLVGYEQKERVADVIRKMNRMRDTRVAHGSTPARGIHLKDMIEFQECARYVVQRAVNHASGGGLFDLGHETT